MTEKLKTLMHDRASLPDFEIPDVDLLVRDGSRRARRRGLAAAGGGAAAATAAVLVVVTALSGGGPADQPGPAIANDPLTVVAPTYAQGSVIHAGNDSVEVGHQVSAYVRTSVGYVVADRGGQIWSVAAGSVSLDRSRPMLSTLAWSPTPKARWRAGWIAQGERPAFVFFDQSTGEIVRNSEATAPGMGLLADEADPAYLFGIDGDAAYWRDQRGLVSFDLDSETAAVVDGDVASGFELLAVEDGWLATSAGDHGTDLEGNGQRVRLPDVYASVGFFSPDARWASFDADQPEVFESATGQPIVSRPGRLVRHRLRLARYRDAGGPGRRPRAGPRRPRDLRDPRRHLRGRRRRCRHLRGPRRRIRRCRSETRLPRD